MLDSGNNDTIRELEKVETKTPTVGLKWKKK